MTSRDITKQRHLDISIISLAEATAENRFDAEFYRPEFLIPQRKGLDLIPIGDVLTKCQYGLSLPMNEDCIGYPIFKMDNINEALCEDEGLKCAEISDKELIAYRLKPDDVLFNRVNSIEFVGRTGIYKYPENDQVFASYLIRVNTDKSKVLPDYLDIFLNCKYGRKEINRKARRAVNQANVNAEELKTIRLPIAGMKLQEGVKNAVERAFKKKQIAKQELRAMEQQLLAALGLTGRQAESAGISVRSLSDAQAANRFDAEYWQPKYDEVEAHIKTVRHATFADIFSWKKGIEVGSEAYQDQGIQFIRISNLTPQELTDNDQKYISSELYSDLKDDYAPRKGEILFSKDGTAGIAYHLTDNVEGITSGGILRLSTKDKSIDPDYLAVCLNSLAIQMQVERYCGGSIIQHLKTDDAEKILIPLLNPAQQKTIADGTHTARQKLSEAKALIDLAKRAVETFIEKDEKAALKVIEAA